MTGSGAGARVAGAVRVRVPLRRPWLTAQGSWTACESWLVRVLVDDGRAGWGEATLGPFAGAADQADLDARVRSMIGSPVGRALSLEGRSIEPSADAATDATDGGAVGRAVLAALDGALLDLAALPMMPPRAASIEVNAVVGAESTHASVAAARDAVTAGFRTIKLKAGAERTTAELAERLHAIREAVGPGVALRLDVNGAWSEPVAAERLGGLRDLGLQLVEQPVAPAEVTLVARAMATLREQTRVPLAADESVVSLDAARSLLAAGAVDALVVKPARVGGPLVALAIARAAHDAGAGVVVSTLLETGIGLLVAMATAAALPAGAARAHASLAHGLGTGGALVGDLVGGRSVVSAARRAIDPGPGLGLDGLLDRAAVDRFAIERCGALG